MEQREWGAAIRSCCVASFEHRDASKKTSFADTFMKHVRRVSQDLGLVRKEVVVAEDEEVIMEGPMEKMGGGTFSSSWKGRCVHISSSFGT